MNATGNASLARGPMAPSSVRPTAASPMMMVTGSITTNGRTAAGAAKSTPHKWLAYHLKWVRT